MGKPEGTPSSPQELDAMAYRLYQLQQLGGFKNCGQFAGQIGAAGEYVMKGVYTAPQEAALLSAFAVGGQGASAAERVSQVTKATFAGLFRAPGLKIDPAYMAEFEKSAEYFRRIGVTEETAPIERITKVVDDILAAESKDRTAGKDFKVMDYLIKSGFVNQQDREAIAKLAVTAGTGLLPKLMTMAGEAVTGSGIETAWKAATADIQHQQPKADLAIELQKAEIGVAGGVGPFRDVMMRNAFAAAGGSVAFGGRTLEEVQSTWRADPRNWMLNRGEGALLNQAKRMVFAEAAQYGILEPNIAQGMPARPYSTMIGAGSQMGWEELFGVAHKVREKGGQLTPSLTDQEQTALLRRIADGIDRVSPAAGGPPGAAGAGVAARNGQPPAALLAKPAPFSGRVFDGIGVF
jgi:hypothetical protein